MNKNGKYIYENKIVDELNHAKPAQVGVDLSIAKIEDITGDISFDENSKVHGIEYREVHWALNDNGVKTYYLEPNHEYAIEFEQGLKKLNANEWGLIVQRSSCLRAGIHIVSSIWDPGFTTGEDVMGTTLLTGNATVTIPVGTRVAQILIFENDPVAEEDQYNGQWQGKANH